jgi:hypothetical protein
MLEVLCGNKNVQKILIFLFVNGKCYGTQVSQLLKTSLTPIQKALLRLEKGGIILSDYEGKTRLYRFNPAFPLLNELEQLLKKAYTLLPPQAKKEYCFVQKGKKAEGDQRVLLNFWERLAGVRQLSFNARTKSKEEGGWNGKGKGEVIVTKEGEGVLIFAEKGSWQSKEGKETQFSNVFRWTLDLSAGMISLEHLRRGANHPVFLFHLAPSSNHALSSMDSHLCGGDSYFGQIFSDRHTLRLNWRVIGPKKNEEIDYYYT